ncbi:MAG: cupredoxin domain-containing protein [Candidatus Aquicultorales bacterium]
MSKKAILAALAVLSIVVLAGGCGFFERDSGDDPGSDRTTTTRSKEPTKSAKVDISNFEFKPADVTIEKGGEVTWTNQDSVEHSVKADDGSFDSKRFGNGKSFSRTFDVPGTYTYYCEPHPFMRGKVTVSRGSRGR